MIIIKAVLHDLPLHLMSCMKIPSYIIQQLTQAMSRFWWYSNKNEKRSHGWVSWKDMWNNKSGDRRLGF